MVINHNISSLNTLNKLNANTRAAQGSLEKLSSGLRINKAGDDAAGLAISQKMQSQINGLDQASKNAQDGISLIQTAEGSLSETQSILQRMSTLVNQAANGTLQDTDRTTISTEITQLNSEIDRISKSTQFNGRNLIDGTLGVQLNTTATSGSGIAAGSSAGLIAVDISGAKASSTLSIAFDGTSKYTMTDGSGNSQIATLADSTAGTLNFSNFGVKITVSSANTGAALVAGNAYGGGAGKVLTTTQTAVDIQIGANATANDKLGITIGNMDSITLATSGISVTDATTSNTAIGLVNTAITTVSTARSNLGAWQNRLDHTINNLSVESQNLTSASSQITDVDMAAEMTNFTKNNILTQAAQAMLAQANQLPQGVLSLLK
jgi:flagellin